MIIIGFAAGMAATLGTLLAFGAAFIGIGLLMRRGFGLRSISLDDTLLAFWTGFSCTLLFLILWNFVLPVGWASAVCVLTTGATGVVVARGDLRQVFGRESWRPRGWEVIVLAAGLFWVVDQCMAGFSSWDGGLYHVQAVKWAKSYAVVPGLANLHGPLAFNNSSFLYDAMMDSGWWEGRGFHVANGTLLLGAVLQAMVSGLRCLREWESAHTGRCFAFILLALAFHTASDVATYSTDLPAALVLASAGMVMYRLLDRRDAGPDRGDAHGLFALALLLFAAASIKLTVAVFAAVALPVAFAARCRHWPWKVERLSRSLVWTAVALVLFSGAWMTRGIILSGYPFFPIAAVGFPVEWRAPVEHAQAEVAYIAMTERAFTWGFIGRNWVRLMLVGDVNAALVPGTIAVAAFFTFWVWRRRRPTGPGASGGTWWMLLPLIVAIGVWFVTAPSHRYSPPLFWILAALCVSESQRAMWPHLAGRRRRLALGLIATIAVAPAFATRGFVTVREGSEAARAIRQAPLAQMGPGIALEPLEVEMNMTPFTTRSGLVINVPSRSAAPRAIQHACNNARLPCTPNPAPNLELRVPGRLDRGFKIDGGWEMQDWPYYWQSFFLPEWRARQ